MDLCPGVLRSESHRLGTPVRGSYVGSQAPPSDWKTTAINICLWEAWVPLMCRHKHSLAPRQGGQRSALPTPRISPPSQCSPV